MMTGFKYFLLLVLTVLVNDAAAARLNSDAENHNSQHLLRKRFSPAEFHRQGFDSQWPNPNYPPIPFGGYPNAYTGFNNNRGSGGGSNKPNSGGYNSQGGGGGFNSPTNNFGLNNQGNPRPNQGSSQSNTNIRPNQGSGGFNGGQSSGSSSQGNGGGLSNQGNLNSISTNQGNGQSSNSNSRPNQNNAGSGSQSSSGSSTQSSGGSNNQGGQFSTTQRPPFNVILNENTIDNSTVRECIQTKCPSTNEYNPICGDDNITYQNPSKFKCAQQCRSGVQLSYRGSCVTTVAPN